MAGQAVRKPFPDDLPPPSSARSRTRRSFTRTKVIDFLFFAFSFACAMSIVVITSWLAIQLFIHSSVARHEFGWSFLTTTKWDPVSGQFGALPFMYGTIVTSILALLFAVPMGVATAVFLAEMAPPRISSIFAFLIDLLAAVPSVIYGFLGIFLLVPLLKSYVVPALQSVLGFLPIFGGTFYGVSLFSAGIVLAIMVIPFIISISREVLLSVPNEMREASYALGATHAETIWHVILPYARRGIFGSVFLALARALGETMAATMVIGNDPHIPQSLLAPGYTVAAVIANEFTEATGDLYLSSLIFLGLVLFGITFVINGIARLMILTMGGEAH